MLYSSPYTGGLDLAEILHPFIRTYVTVTSFIFYLEGSSRNHMSHDMMAHK